MRQAPMDYSPTFRRFNKKGDGQSCGCINGNARGDGDSAPFDEDGDGGMFYLAYEDYGRKFDYEVEK